MKRHLKINRAEAFRCHEILIKHARSSRKGTNFKVDAKPQAQSLAVTHVQGMSLQFISCELCHCLLPSRHMFRSLIDNVDTQPMHLPEDIPPLGEDILQLAFELVGALDGLSSEESVWWWRQWGWWHPSGGKVLAHFPAVFMQVRFIHSPSEALVKLRSLCSNAVRRMKSSKNHRMTRIWFPHT